MVHPRPLKHSAVTTATILNAFSKQNKACTNNEILAFVGLTRDQYDMSTRLFNLAQNGYLKKTKKKGEHRNLYEVTPKGMVHLRDHSAEIQRSGQLELLPKAKAKVKINKPVIQPPELEPVLSSSATKAFDELSILITANDAMNTALEKCEQILTDVVDDVDIESISQDILGMPVVDARSKKWKGLFASIAQLVFDNAATYDLISDIQSQLDMTLREKYGEQSESKVK